mmetsp:Transcript_29630/g.95132  ORF Transcript_29630/g.95132 Transcript_29630/m.95132 type:complete len:393 (+) Transcript_29630:957-2135(+)
MAWCTRPARWLQCGQVTRSSASTSSYPSAMMERISREVRRTSRATTRWSPTGCRPRMMRASPSMRTRRFTPRSSFMYTTPASTTSSSPSSSSRGSLQPMERSRGRSANQLPCRARYPRQCGRRLSMRLKSPRGDVDSSIDMPTTTSPSATVSLQNAGTWSPGTSPSPICIQSRSSSSWAAEAEFARVPATELERKFTPPLAPRAALGGAGPGVLLRSALMKLLSPRELARSEAGRKSLVCLLTRRGGGGSSGPSRRVPLRATAGAARPMLGMCFMALRDLEALLASAICCRSTSLSLDTLLRPPSTGPGLPGAASGGASCAPRTCASTAAAAAPTAILRCASRSLSPVGSSRLVGTTMPMCEPPPPTGWGPPEMTRFTIWRMPSASGSAVTP